MPKPIKQKISPIWFLYIVECADKTLYTGITTGVTDRIAKHNSGTGAKYTRIRRPVQLMYVEELPNRSTASKREAAVKKLTRLQKQSLFSQVQQVQ